MFSLYVDDDIELRLYDKAYATEFYRLIDRNRDHIGQFMVWPDNYSQVADAHRYIRKMRRHYGKGASIDTQIIVDGAIAGGMSLFNKASESNVGEIGYWIGKEFTGRGIVTRSARRLLDYAFTTRQLRKVIIICATENHKSSAIPERLGFSREATLIQHIAHHDRYFDAHRYYILADEWTPQIIAPDFRYVVAPADETTDAIELRLPRKADAPALFALTNNNRAHLRRWLPWVDDVTSIEDSRAFISRALNQYGKDNGWQALIWQGDQLAGVVGYHYWDHRNKKTEIGYWLGDNFTGRGIMTRSVAQLVRYAFEVVGLHRIENPCATENTASCAIPQRLGFSHEGTIRGAEFLYNRYVDWDMYALLSHEWKNQQARHNLPE